MRTSKPIATISYNTLPFLIQKLKELIKNHVISDYMIIYHYKEADESKDHFHLWMKPNTRVDTMDIQDHFKEYDPEHPDKPLKCIDFKLGKEDDWILYCQHFEPYLASKGESREFHYTKEDFMFYDADNFEDLYNHAFRGSEWARRYQILQQIGIDGVHPSELIMNGIVPLNMAGNLNALYYMKTHYLNVLDRGGRKGHE